MYDDDDDDDDNDDDVDHVDLFVESVLLVCTIERRRDENKQAIRIV